MTDSIYTQGYVEDKDIFDLEIQTPDILDELQTINEKIEATFLVPKELLGKEK